MKNNKLTLIIDGGWLLMSRFSVLERYFIIDQPNIGQSQEILVDLLMKAVFGMLNKFHVIDNIIITDEGGSWRKKIEVPTQLGTLSYKGNRERVHNHDWAAVYSAWDTFINICKEFGITTSQATGCEGDDWVWYWSKYLNDNKINAMIWTSDGDLKQLINKKGPYFTTWFNDKAGMIIHESLYDKQSNIDNPLDFMLSFEMPINTVLEELERKSFKTSYLNPDLIVMEKVICGDAGDNVMPCAQVIKNNKKYGVGHAAFKRIYTHIGKPATIQEFIDEFADIAFAIPKLIKIFDDYDVNKILEMLKYNLKMVWLHQDTIPQDIIEKMQECEYNVCDCKDLRESGYQKYKSKVKNKDIDVDIDSLF